MIGCCHCCCGCHRCQPIWWYQPLPIVGGQVSIRPRPAEPMPGLTNAIAAGKALLHS